MTPLRKHLQAGKEAHQQMSYPGDLFADVLWRRKRQWVVRLFSGGGLAAAIAACIVVAVFWRQPIPVGSGPNSTPLAQVFPQVPAMPSMPAEMPLAAPHVPVSEMPAMEDAPAMPAMPSMPGWGLSLSDSSDGSGSLSE